MGVGRGVGAGEGRNGAGLPALGAFPGECVQEAAEAAAPPTRLPTLLWPRSVRQGPCSLGKIPSTHCPGPPAGFSAQEAGVLPGLLLGLDLPDDILHPQHEVPHHAEEAELVPCVHQPHPAALTGVQQGLPGLQDLVLPLLDVISLVTRVGCLEAGRILLQLPHLGSGGGDSRVRGRALAPSPHTSFTRAPHTGLFTHQDIMTPRSSQFHQGDHHQPQGHYERTEGQHYVPHKRWNK